MWFEDRNSTGFTAEIDELLRDLTVMGYWENHIAHLWVEGRRTEIYRLRESGSPEVFERLSFIAGMLRRERDRVRTWLEGLPEPWLTVEFYERLHREQAARGQLGELMAEAARELSEKAPRSRPPESA